MALGHILVQSNAGRSFPSAMPWTCASSSLDLEDLGRLGGSRLVTQRNNMLGHFGGQHWYPIATRKLKRNWPNGATRNFEAPVVLVELQNDIATWIPSWIPSHFASSEDCRWRIVPWMHIRIITCVWEILGVYLRLGSHSGGRYLHSQSPTIVHRDLKSLNVVLDLSLNIKASWAQVDHEG